MRGKKVVVGRREDQSKTCTICGKMFVNGKALGGHLRSHYAKLPVREPPTGRRSSRSRGSGPARFDSRSFFSEEYGAECLMMLSRDSWERKSGTPQVGVKSEDLYFEGNRNRVVLGEDNDKLRLNGSFCVGGYCSGAGGSMIDLNRLPGLQNEDGGGGLTEEEVSSTEEDE